MRRPLAASSGPALRGLLALSMLSTTMAAAQIDADGVSDSVPDSDIAVGTRLLAEGLTAPIDLQQPADGSGRYFVLDQSGLIRLLDADGRLRSAPLLDLRPRLLTLEPGFEERGLLGFALHPRFADNGRLYVSYSAPLREGAPPGWNHTRRVAEFTVAGDRADPDSERVLLELDWPSRKHNGGGLSFGADGYLYIGLGDGGGVHGVGKKVLFDAFEVPAENARWDDLAQDLDSWFGKVLRIDVDRGFPGYAIPPHNPLLGRPGRDEIYAWGFRNPYRIALDPPTGVMLVSATAETLWESIYLLDRPGNYGWALKEGSHCFARLTPLAPPADCARYDAHGYRLREPVVEYANKKIALVGGELQQRFGEGLGTAVVGGQIYRGEALPALAGKLVFADWSADFQRPSGQLFAAGPAPRFGAPWQVEKLAELPTRILSVARDAAGELYILSGDELGPFGDTGRVYRLE